MGRRLHAPSCLTRPPRSPGPGSAPRRCAASRLAGTTTVERGAIASEAIQSPATTLDCFVAALLAMTVVKHAFSSSHPLSRPSVAHLIALSRMRARGRPGAGRHPWPACSRKSRRQSPQVRAGSSGLPRAMVGTAYTCSPRGPAFCPRRPRARRTWQRELGLSTGRPGPHDFAVRIGSFVGMIAHAATRHAHRIPHPTLVTIAMRPSSEAGWRDHSIDFRKTEGV